MFKGTLFATFIMKSPRETSPNVMHSSLVNPYLEP